jgi:DNA-binding NarL/FixJ family response regulator
MPETARRSTVLLADDYPGMTTTLTRVLRPFFDVVGQVSDGLELFDAATRLRPDVVVLDVRMPGLNGLDACRRLKTAVPDVCVIVYTGVDDDQLRAQAFAMGASAFVPKGRPGDELVTAIRDAVTPGQPPEP